MSSRLVVLFVPFVIIAIFWLMARREAKLRHDPTHKGYFERNGMVLGIGFIFMVALWTLFLVVLPYLYMVVESFHPTLRPVERGGPLDVLTIEQYQSFFVAHGGEGANTVHIGAFIFSILASIAVTALNFCICYPLAYYMAQSGTPQKVRLLMLALIVPYWVNEILRAFSLRLMLATKGLINNILVAGGFIDTPIDFLGHNVGLYVGLSYAYLLVMIFPLYNAIESLDKNQVEAARDLGAPWWRIHKDVVIP